MPSDIRPLTKIVINGIEYSVADEIVQELLGVIYENNTAVAERINDLNDRVLNNYSYIQSINGTLTKSDWNESDSTSYAYILNKPDITVNQNDEISINAHSIDINASMSSGGVDISGSWVSIDGYDLSLSSESNSIDFAAGGGDDADERQEVPDQC